MRSKEKHVVILDGYNVIHRVPSLEALLNKSLEAARDGLFRYCRSWMSSRKDVWLFYIVFDGSSEVVSEGDQPGPGIRTIYTRTGEKADTRILDILDELENVSRATVVSDDNFVKRNSRIRNSELMTVAEFFGIMTSRQQKTSRKISNLNSPKKNLSPAQQKAINEELKDAWGIE